MMYRKKNPSLKRKIKYFFFIALTVWILVSIYVIYQYLLTTSKQVVSKGGTFVEGIFGETSFLPYLRQDIQSSFYQGLLFKSCLSFESNKEESTYVDELCHPKTKDYKTYYISLLSGHTRSDGVPVTLEDVFFTYNDVISHNTWKISGLNKYSDIEVSLTDDGQVKVVFPQASIDNTFFFTNYILPRHALLNTTLAGYQSDFSMEPIYTQCAHILPQSTDQYSLVFDLLDCEDSYLGYYQIKNTVSFQDFKTAVNLNGSIVEFYENQNQVSGYIEHKLSTNKLVTLFFNTKSNKASVRLRRALGGLIMHNFYTGNYNDYIQQPHDGLFKEALSTGGNIKSFLNRIDSDDSLSKEDLIDGGVNALPKSINISGTNQKFVYFLDNNSKKTTLELIFDIGYNKIAIQHEKGAEYSPKSYIKSKKTGKYNIGSSLGNINPGVNKYTIYGRDKKEKKVVATIDLYNLKGHIPSTAIAANDQKLVVLYTRDPNSIFVIEHLQNMFSKFNILEYFVFQGVDTPDELDGRLTMGDYDIVINTINLGFKKDRSKLFSTDKAQINPSQYSNQRFVSLMQQYLTAEASQQGHLLSQVNSIYETDMPFVILGSSYGSLFAKQSVRNKLDIDKDMQLYEHNRRSIVYDKLRLVKNINIDIKSLGNLGQFFNFLTDSINNQEDNNNDKDENPIENTENNAK